MSDAYFAERPCGCVVAAIVLDARPADLAEFLAEQAMAGLTIGRADVEVVRSRFATACSHVPEEPELDDHGRALLRIVVEHRRLGAAHERRHEAEAELYQELLKDRLRRQRPAGADEEVSRG
jgi:hypothetical protein